MEKFNRNALVSGPLDGDSSGRADPLGLARHERYATHRQREWGFQWDTRTPPHQVGSILQSLRYTQVSRVATTSLFNVKQIFNWNSLNESDLKY